VKPSPFYLLDEVDAALDDANVDRLSAMIREVAPATSQMLIVTHNKKTMELAERHVRRHDAGTRREFDRQRALDERPRADGSRRSERVAAAGPIAALRSARNAESGDAALISVYDRTGIVPSWRARWRARHRRSTRRRDARASARGRHRRLRRRRSDRLTRRSSTAA
jgi:energy-coupling factor transporter ATP-binding protein EcfA2